MLKNMVSRPLMTDLEAMAASAFSLSRTKVRSPRLMVVVDMVKWLVVRVFQAAYFADPDYQAKAKIGYQTKGKFRFWARVNLLIWYTQIIHNTIYSGLANFSAFYKKFTKLSFSLFYGQSRGSPPRLGGVSN